MSLSTESNGFLKIVMGPMFAGKSTFLIHEIAKYPANNVVAIKHSVDTRYYTEVCENYGISCEPVHYIISHNKEVAKCLGFHKLRDILNNDVLSGKDVIFIDEAQFFDDLFEVVIILVEKLGKSVYLAGLDGDFKRRSFGNGDLMKLIPYADEVIKIRGHCQVAGCQKESLFSMRTSADESQIVVGNNYIPVCRYHYNNPQ